MRNHCIFHYKTCICSSLGKGVNRTYFGTDEVLVSGASRKENQSRECC